MSDPELATKAPESDGMEDQPLGSKSDATSSTTPAQDPTPPHAHENCTTDRPVPSGQQSSGSITTYADNIETYISKPADYPSTPARLLLLLTNGRGVHSVNNQLQADLYAKNGFVVVMPDMFGGDPAPNTTAAAEEVSEQTSWLDTIKTQIVSTSKSFVIDMWLARQTPEKVLPIIHKALAQARDEFADAVSHGGGVYAAGYCFGGKYVLILAGERSDTVMQGQDGNEQAAEEGMVRTGPEIKCGAIAHGTLVTREDLKAIKMPVSLVCVENDPLFPEDVLDYGRKEFAASNVEHEVKVHPAVPHGFAVVGEYDSMMIKEAQIAAFDQMVNWLLSH